MRTKEERFCQCQASGLSAISMPGLIGIKDCFRNCEHLRDTNPQLGRHPGRVRYRLDYRFERNWSLNLIQRAFLCAKAPRLTLGDDALRCMDTCALRLRDIFGTAGVLLITAWGRSRACHSFPRGSQSATAQTTKKIRTPIATYRGLTQREPLSVSSHCN